MIARCLERASGQRRLKKLYDRYRASSRPPGESFWEAAMRMLEVSIRHDPERLAMIPAGGPLVIVANHPFGVLDGVVHCALTSRIRRDFKLMVHAALYQAPEAMPDLLPIDFSGGSQAARTILAPRNEALAHLRRGGCLIVFPAGAVATTPGLLSRKAVDAAWGPLAGKLVRRSGATVVPFHFARQNSWLFQAASHVSYTVRLSLMFRETARRIGSEVLVRLGRPIPPGELTGFGSDEALAAELRARTEALASEPAPTPVKRPRRFSPRPLGAPQLLSIRQR